MIKEIALVESRTLRDQFCIQENIAILDRVSTLVSLPECGYATTEQVAEFYQVPVETIKQIVKRHRDELEQDGYKVMPAAEFYALHGKAPYGRARYIAVFSRRAILRVGMVLAESKVAKQVRHYLLAIEQKNLNSAERQDLITIAGQLRNHALEIANTARCASSNAGQLVEQADAIEAISRYIQQDRAEIEKVRGRVDELESRMSLLHLPQKAQSPEECISDQQINTLRQKVREMPGKPITIWKKFHQAFGIPRYKFLPARQFEDALAWLEQYASGATP